MNVPEYLKRLDTTGQVLSEEAGRVYFVQEPESEQAWDDARSITETVDGLADWRRWDGERLYFSAETQRLLTETELRLDPGTEDYDTPVRRPYYRMRGRPITPRQAWDVIRRTDGLIGELMRCASPGACRSAEYVGALNFNQWWFSRNHFPGHYGWSHPDGRIGCNAVTQKYPCFTEYLNEMLRWKQAFPYLDLMIAVTDWDETPPACCDARGAHADDMDTDAFCAHLEIGVCTHDRVIEFMDPAHAAARYRTYARRFAPEDEGVFRSDWYERQKKLVCGEDALLRCIMAYGVDERRAREMRAGLPEYMWRDDRF